MNKRENTKNCWLVAITNMIAIIGLIVGLVYYSNQISSAEAKHAALQNQVDRLNNVVNERLESLDKLVDEKVKRIEGIHMKEDSHTRELINLRFNQMKESPIESRVFHQ